ncbi:hypothetical protein CW745_07225 [Psychromonas sp. psych-6C06]|uniref:PEP-CTERM sorting domain-containing protein n=1 Tax=Psychromonas sp. psych-6C06 TaxID=2058089 RepID=UPI000C31D58C|nr:PEP-CTERM sorting domain-containing protein [Psychromonas sp. psych-6C06]PKF62179.1 hypothetical protein CW745_07225 [Psychromonas sp. psych-6C06]
MKNIGLLICCGLLTANVNATIMTGEVAQDAYVTYENYDLAWASPCSDGLLERSCAAIDLSEQSNYGWSVMTSDLFASLGINASTFKVDYSSANTESYNGNNYAKATGWFSNSYTHIDVTNGLAGLWSFVDVADADSYYETIVYRSAKSIDVPAPASVALFALGMAGLAFSRRKFKR